MGAFRLNPPTYYPFPKHLWRNRLIYIIGWKDYLIQQVGLLRVFKRLKELDERNIKLNSDIHNAIYVKKRLGDEISNLRNDLNSHRREVNQVHDKMHNLKNWLEKTRQTQPVSAEDVMKYWKGL